MSFPLALFFIALGVIGGAAFAARANDEFKVKGGKSGHQRA